MNRQKSTTGAIVLAAIVLCSAVTALGRGRPISNRPAAKTEYVCPPCGCDNDNDVFDKPGVCPSCGMALVEKSSLNNRAAASPARPKKEVAILIFNGVQIIDYTGPYEVFGEAGFHVYTVSETSDPIITTMGMKVIPNYTFDNTPKPDIVVVPGGGVTRTQTNPVVLKWLRDASEKAEMVLSVCNGAYILAKAGLLDGLRATTTAHLIDGLAAAAPNIKVVHDQRFVDNGKIITAGGLSAGIDGAIHVVSRVMGSGNAQALALGMEYNWDPATGFVRPALADR
ncbi:MAG TPA: DJ-1/PfpI family protein, partial [Blastocatellia bacterium]|nr:DJ-1/PfpI family protein [Blastocatellia bacterium]